MGRVIGIHYENGRHVAGPPKRDDRFFPIIEWVVANGALDKPWLVPVRFTENRGEAEAVKRSLYNAARYYCSCGARHCVRKYKNTPPDNGCPDGGQRVGCQAKLVMVNAHVRVQFKFFDKAEAIRQVVATYGPDPSKWPYFAKARTVKED